MEMDSNEKGDNQDRTPSSHMDPTVSAHTKQLKTSVPAQGEEVAEHTGRKSETLRVPSTDTKHSTQKYNPTKLAALSSTCECKPTVVKPFRCGLCCKAYRTICKLHEHMEYAHRENEMYLFDKTTQTAFPRYESSSVATQTDAEIDLVQHEGREVDRTGSEFGDAEQEIGIPCGEFLDSAHALDETEHSDKNTTGHDFCRFSDDNSEVLNTHEDVVVKTEDLYMEVKTEVFPSDDEYTPQSEKRNRLLSKKKKKGGPNVVKRKSEKSKGSKISIKKLKMKPSQTLTTDDSNAKPTNLTGDDEGTKLKTMTRGDAKTKSKTLKSDDDKDLTSDDDNTEQETSTSDDDSCLFRCRYCKLEFSSRFLQREHVFDVHLIMPCKLCDKRYSSMFYLNSHIRRMHSDIQNVTCENCGETFATGNLLYKHNKKCLDISFACPFENCDKKYERKTTLVAHMTIHSGKFPFICHVCGKGFTLSCDVKRHVKRQHSEERPWRCDQCTAAFATKGCLSRHLKTHAQEKVHKCHCGKSFTNSWNLKAHARQHTGEKPYFCEFCGAQFTHNVSRKNHMKVHTGGV